MFSCDIRRGTKIPTILSRMNVPRADQKITHAPAKNCHFNSVKLP